MTTLACLHCVARATTAENTTLVILKFNIKCIPRNLTPALSIAFSSVYFPTLFNWDRACGRRRGEINEFDHRPFSGKTTQESLGAIKLPP